MNGAAPGPAPAAHARASNARLTRSSWRTWPQRKLRKNVPRVDGALTVQASTLAVPPERNVSYASASSMQSPPASAEAMRVSNRWVSASTAGTDQPLLDRFAESLWMGDAP